MQGRSEKVGVFLCLCGCQRATVEGESDGKREKVKLLLCLPIHNPNF